MTEGMQRSFWEEGYGIAPEGRVVEAGWPSEVWQAAGRVGMRVPSRALGSAQPEPLTLTVWIAVYGSDTLRVAVQSLPEGDAFPTESPMLETVSDPVPLALQLLPDGRGWRGVDPAGTVRFHLEGPGPIGDPWSDLLPSPHPGFHLTVYPDGKTPVKWSATDHFFPAKVDAMALGAGLSSSNEVVSLGGALHLHPEEVLCGTGERFAPLNLCGRTVVLENADAMGVNNTFAYKNVPWVLSSRGYGVFVHTSLAAVLSLGEHSTRSLQFAVPDTHLDLFIIGGGDPDAVLRAYRRLTGVPRPIPQWSLGIWMSRMTYFSAAEVEAITKRLREEEWPCDVIHLDTGWFAKDWVCEWEFGDQFPDPEAFMARLREDGFRVTLWQNPNILRECRWLEELTERGYLGEPLEAAKQAGGESDFSDREVMGQLDFSHEGAVVWYQEKLRRLLEMGAEAIKTDFGESINMQVKYAGMEARRLRNLYALLYQRAAAEVTEAVHGHGLIWARAGWAGCQRYPVHWGGDCACTWDGMAASLRGGLHLGLSGFACWSHDVPGFHGVPDFMNTRPTPLLYLRWTQFGCFTSHFRYHGTSEREPWFYPEVAEAVKAWWRLRYAILPYIEAECESLRHSGRPFLAALCFEDPEDALAWKCDDQFMAGRDILVAPVMNASGKRPVWLPRGEWVDLWTGERFGGRQWLAAVEHPPERLPVYLRAGARIPICPIPVRHTAEIPSGTPAVLAVDESYEGLKKSPLAARVRELL